MSVRQISARGVHNDPHGIIGHLTIHHQRAGGVEGHGGAGDGIHDGAQQLIAGVQNGTLRGHCVLRRID